MVREVADLLRIFYRETGVMDFDLMSSLSVEMICVFYVEDRTALSNEGKLLSRLLKTSSEPGMERTQQSKASCRC